jgi:RND family efflux transporter MFP subunit
VTYHFHGITADPPLAPPLPRTEGAAGWGTRAIESPGRLPVATVRRARAGRPFTPWRIVLVAIVVASSGGRAGAEGQSDEVIVLRRCVVDYERATGVGVGMNGVLQECLVAPGDRIEAGQALGRLRDEDVRMECQLRELDAGSDIAVRLSTAKEAQARSKLIRTAVLLRRNAVSQEEYNLHRLEVEAAALEVEQARIRHQAAQIQLSLAQAQVQARTFRSPHEGVVVAVLKHRGEPVASNETVFRIVDSRHLDIVGQVDVTDVWRLRVGQPVRVVPEIAGADLPVEREVFSGRLAFVDTHIDPITRTCKVVAKVENRGELLRAGLEARMEIDREAARDGVAGPGTGGSGPIPPPLGGPTSGVEVGLKGK